MAPTFHSNRCIFAKDSEMGRGVPLCTHRMAVISTYHILMHLLINVWVDLLFEYLFETFQLNSIWVWKGEEVATPPSESGANSGKPPPSPRIYASLCLGGDRLHRVGRKCKRGDVWSRVAARQLERHQLREVCIFLLFFHSYFLVLTRTSSYSHSHIWT